MNQCWLVNIVNNDFHQSHEIFRIFDGLEAQDMDKVFNGQQLEKDDHRSNGEISGHAADNIQLIQHGTTQTLHISPYGGIGETPLEN